MLWTLRLFSRAVHLSPVCQVAQPRRLPCSPAGGAPCHSDPSYNFCPFSYFLQWFLGKEGIAMTVENKKWPLDWILKTRNNRRAAIERKNPRILTLAKFLNHWRRVRRRNGSRYRLFGSSVPGIPAIEPNTEYVNGFSSAGASAHSCIRSIPTKRWNF